MSSKTSKNKDQKAKRFTRTRSGCLTCKKRHIKCDETPEVCLQCRKDRLKCDGYAPPKIWMFEPKTRPPTAITDQTIKSNLNRIPAGYATRPQLLISCGNVVDPFQASPVALNHETVLLLQFYTQVVEPIVSGHWKPGQNVPTTTLHDCFHDRLRMQGILTESACHMEHVVKLPGSQGKTICRIQECTREVKQYIEHCRVPSPALAFAALHLCGAEEMRDNLHASMIHLKGARDIIQQLGGLDMLDNNTKHILLGIDGYRAVQLMHEPFFPCIDPGNALEFLGDIPGLMDSLRTPSSFGTALESVEYSELCPSRLQSLAHQLAEALNVWQYAWKMELENSRIWYWLLVRFQAIRHGMLSTKSVTPDFEAVRVSMIIWNTMVRSKWGAQKIVKAAAPHLRSILQKCKVREPHWTSQSRLWMLLIGGIAAEDTPAEAWFKHELQLALGSGNLEKFYVKLKDASTNCFHFEYLQDEQLRNYLHVLYPR